MDSQGINFSCFKIFLIIRFSVVWDNSNWKQTAKQYKQRTSPESNKTQIKILAYPGLAQELYFAVLFNLAKSLFWTFTSKNSGALQKK